MLGLPLVPGGLAADGGAALKGIVPRVGRVGVGGVPAALLGVGGVGVDRAGLSHRAGVVGVVVDDDRRAQRAVVVDPLHVHHGQPDAAQAGAGAQQVELVVLHIVLVLAVVGHAVEQVAVIDAGRVLAVARAHQQPPAVVHRGRKIPGGGVHAAAAHHRHERHSVLFCGRIHGVDRDHAACVVDRQQVGVALLCVQRQAIGGKLRFQPGQRLCGVVVPGRRVLDLRRVLGGVARGRRHRGGRCRLGRRRGACLRRGGGGRRGLRRRGGQHVLWGVGHLHAGTQQRSRQQKRKNAA